MEPKKLTESQVRLMTFLYRNKKKHTRRKLMDLLEFDKNILSLSIMPISGYFIYIEKQKTKGVGRKGDLISLTEAGKMVIRAWIIANGKRKNNKIY